MTSKYNKNKKGAYEAQPSESLMFLPYVDVFFDLRLNKPMATERFFFAMITNQKLVNGDVTFTPAFISQNQWKFVRNSACHLRKNENMSIFSKKDWMQCNEKRKAMQNVTKALNWNNIFFVHGSKKQLKDTPPTVITIRSMEFNSTELYCTSVYLSHSLGRFMFSLQNDLDADSD